MSLVCMVSIGGMAVALSEGDVVIGRSPFCTLCIPHERLSRMHAAFRRNGDEITLRDLGSTNGTFVNGERLGKEPVRVTDQDRIQIGPLDCWLTRGAQLGGRSRTARGEPNVSTDGQDAPPSKRRNPTRA